MVLPKRNLNPMQMPPTYLLSGDTHLLPDGIKHPTKIHKLAFEIGTGTGIIVVKLTNCCEYVVATNISRDAI